MKIYVPELENYSCYVVRSENVIRAYKQVPYNNSTIEYRDYYYNSDYLYNDGEQSFSQYTTLPVCLDYNMLTNDFYYRQDIDKIMLIFLILFIFIILIPIKIVLRFFRRFN